MDGTVLVTGAGGFVGSAVVRRLVAGERPAFWDGTPVRHVVALLRPGGSRERLEELPRDSGWSVQHADLADSEGFAGVLHRVRPRAVLHVALDRAAYRQVLKPDADPLVTRPLETLFKALSGVPDSRLVHTGSAWVLGPGDRLAEDVPLSPRSPYARNKARADALLPVLGRRSGVPWINLRLFNTFGRHEAPTRLLPYLVARLSAGAVAELSHGEQVRDFTDVDAMADAYALALKAPEEACGAVYHVGSGRGSTIRAFAEAVTELVGNRDLLRFGAGETRDQDLPCLVAAPALATRRLGWSPDPDLRGGIHRAVRWWLRRSGLEGEGPVAAGHAVRARTEAAE